MLLVIKFKLRGTLRFLSHAEMLRVFQRACVRAGISIIYSQGFNPRPKISLPLPRPVGVESDEELLCLRVAANQNQLQAANHESQIKDRLSAQLPEGCELYSVNIAREGMSFQPLSATYIIEVLPGHFNEGMTERIEHLLASETLNVQRHTEKKKAGFKNIDVRKFLKSIKLDNRDIIVECYISTAGSIRIEEILKLLELGEGKLASPIRRTNVQWQDNEYKSGHV